MRRLWIAGLLVACSGPGDARHPPQPRQSPPPHVVDAPPQEPTNALPPAVMSEPATPNASPLVSERSTEPARRFAQDTSLSLYRYHMSRVGNTQGYLAPLLPTSDGGFLVVGTRSTNSPGRYQAGKSRPVVAKLDERGAVVWERAYPKAGFLDYEGGSAIEVEGGYVIYILSYVHPGRGSVARLVRIDEAGGVKWDLRLRGDGGQGTPHPQTVRLEKGQLLLEGHIYKDASETAYGWRGTVSLEGEVLSDEVGAANPYD